MRTEGRLLCPTTASDSCQVRRMHTSGKQTVLRAPASHHQQLVNRVAMVSVLTMAEATQTVGEPMQAWQEVVLTSTSPLLSQPGQ